MKIIMDKTSDIRGDLVKEEALRRSEDAYVLADDSKFDKISTVTFDDINKGTIITTRILDINTKI
ncbi:DeoR family transcriptional regulator [Clostridium botulinum]|uniref:DeoR family transcriptional regulator n=1 Tax=Clostridium botulinum TaxID=1491 RepID=UPI001FA931C9|nr:DeoR family transcriptional regulator [Clostridium botulinum]MCJ8172993.1 DeoR family transcriptional regulator [Clostridium botulinum]